VVFEVPHEMPALDGDYIEFMWLKDANTNAIIAAKKFRPADVSPPTLVASVSSGTRVTACSKASLHGVWQGSFTAP
jgi:desulfoferrodoxin (superoxide reductase-like protein)